MRPILGFSSGAPSTETDHPFPEAGLLGTKPRLGAAF